jgi:hypothetical protein
MIAPILADIYTHAQLDALFAASGFPGDPPGGSKPSKCLAWMRNTTFEDDDALDRLGQLIAEFMDSTPAPAIDTPWLPKRPQQPDPRVRISEALGKEGLSYQRGGYILGSKLTGPSRPLAERLKAEGTEALEREYRRAYAAIENDPGTAITAACAILESVCKFCLESNGQNLPNKQVLSSLWQETAKMLGLSPKDIADDDLKRILQGLYSLADGIAALRTHEGSAHGRSSKARYRLRARHARLAVHAAHTMALFVLETHDERSASTTNVTSA